MALRGNRPFVFLDKDGTLVVDVPYNVDPGLVELMPTAAAGLRLLADAGFGLAVVSNQAGVALGRFAVRDLDPLEDRLRALVADAGAALEACFWCTDAPGTGCGCRKPAPGLLTRAAEELDVDLGRSWMVGDILDDVEAGNRAGCRTALVDTGGETEWLDGPLRIPDLVAGTFLEAASAIVERTPPSAASAAHRAARAVAWQS